MIIFTSGIYGDFPIFILVQAVYFYDFKTESWITAHASGAAASKGSASTSAAQPQSDGPFLRRRPTALPLPPTTTTTTAGAQRVLVMGGVVLGSTDATSTDATSTDPSSAVVHLGFDPDTKEVVARWCVRGSGAGPTFPFAEAASVPTRRLFGPSRQKSVKLHPNYLSSIV